LAIILCVAIFLYFVFVPAVQAEIYYNLEVKGIYEDNVVGLLSDKRGGYAGMAGTAGPGMMSTAVGMGPGMGPAYTGSSSSSNSDTSINFFADLGGFRMIAPDTSLFLTGSAEHTSYSSFTQFNSTIGGLSTGINRGFGDVLTARFAINGMIKRYGDSQRDSSAYGATFSLKERLDPVFWLKENYVYEKNDADSPLFTYNGNAVNIWAGYLVTPQATVLAGYNYLVRDYDQPSGFKVTAHTISLGLSYELVKKWFLNAQYDHQASDSNVPGTNTTDNMFSIGLRYGY
jgi:predicted porin